MFPLTLICCMTIGIVESSITMTLSIVISRAYESGSISIESDFLLIWVIFINILLLLLDIFEGRQIRMVLDILISLHLSFSLSISFDRPLNEILLLMLIIIHLPLTIPSFFIHELILRYLCIVIYFLMLIRIPVGVIMRLIHP